MKTSDDAYEIFTDPKSMDTVRDALQKKGYDTDTAEVRLFPENTTDRSRRQKFLNTPA